MTLDNVIDFCKCYKTVYCYGAGNVGRIVKAYLDESGINISGFIISNKAKEHYGRILEIPVYSLEYLTKVPMDNTGVLICTDVKYHQDIISNLRKNKIDNYLCIDSDVVQEMLSKTMYKKRYYSNNNINVFVYHRVAELPQDTFSLAITRELFEKQIEYIKCNYQVLRSTDEWEANDKPRAIITFDDGYADFYTNALPILEKYEVPATIFVSTGNLNSTEEFWWDKLERIIFEGNSKIGKIIIFNQDLPLVTKQDREKACYFIHTQMKRMLHEERERVLNQMALELQVSLEGRNEYRLMTYEELKKISESPYVTIGGHTVTHSCLANETGELQKWEIGSSKSEIENIIGKEITVFSYPFGQIEDFTEETIHIAKQYGYKKVFAAYAGLTSHFFVNGRIPRNNIGQVVDMEEAKKKIRMLETLYSDDYI